MNNLSQLNSKWYWRLLKVIWVISYILVFSFSSFWIIYYLSHYNPIKLEKAEKIIKEKSTIISSIENIEQKLPWKDLKISDFKKIIKEEYLNNVNAIAINYVIIEFLWKTMSSVWVCKEYYNYPLYCDETNSGTILKAINDKSNNSFIMLSHKTYQESNDIFNDYYKVESDAIETINSLINWESTRANFYDFNNKFGVNINDIIWQEYEYRSLFDYVKIISSILGVLLWIFTFNFILLRIIYYIVLGQFFPKKD